MTTRNVTPSRYFVFSAIPRERQRRPLSPFATWCLQMLTTFLSVLIVGIITIACT